MSLARRWEITAVPTFILQDRAVVGAQPYGVLEKFVVESGVGERKPKKGQGKSRG